MCSRPNLERQTGKKIKLNIQEIHQPELDAQLVAESIGEQINKRVSYKRAMKQAVQRAMRLGAQGVRIKCSGRLGGAEMSRVSPRAMAACRAIHCGPISTTLRSTRTPTAASA